MSRLRPLPRFQFDAGSSVEAPFDVLVKASRNSGAETHEELDRCALELDPVKAVLMLAAVYLAHDGYADPTSHRSAIQALKDAAHTRHQAGTGHPIIEDEVSP